jgi:hypothetical protein
MLFSKNSTNARFMTIVGIGINIMLNNSSYIGFLVLNSDDYGNTFSVNTSFDIRSDTPYNVCMNGNGQYQTVVTLNSTFSSRDYGRTFTKMDTALNTGYNFYLSLESNYDGYLLTAVDIFGQIYYCYNTENSEYSVSETVTRNIAMGNFSSDSTVLYPVSTLSGTYDLLLPEINKMFPSKLRTIIVYDDEGNANYNNFTIRPSGTDTILKYGDHLTCNTDDAYIQLKSDGKGKWLTSYVNIQQG